MSKQPSKNPGDVTILTKQQISDSMCSFIPAAQFKEDLFGSMDTIYYCSESMSEERLQERKEALFSAVYKKLQEAYQMGIATARENK